MEKFDPEIDIGEIIASRIRNYPFLEKEPKVKRIRKGAKSKPKKNPPCWIVCPSFIVQPPRKIVSKEDHEKEYIFIINIYSDTRKERDEALAHMIDCSKEEIEAGNKRFWSNGTRKTIQRRSFWEAELEYFFRVKQAPEENLIRR